jgi:hypothetical protein
MAAVFLDSNLLILLVTGTASRDYIGKHKRLRAYDEADYDQLLEFIASYSPIVVTPNTLTETSNLLNQIAEPIRTHISLVFKMFLEGLEERFVESRRASNDAEFVQLGLTDCALLSAIDRSHLLLTADLDLFVAAVKRGYQAINFNHIRLK